MKELSPEHIKDIYKEKRDAYDKVLEFIKSERCLNGVVQVIYGLRRTGKTTIMEQIIANNPDIKSHYYEATKTDTMEDVYNHLDNALQKGYKCVFIDEITSVPDFIDNSAMLADIYAKQGLRIILAGTDSLSFVFAEESSLFDRAEHISTTYIPFAEHSRVLKTNDIDEYISYGGLMKKGARREEYLVYDYITARKYVDDAVSDNITKTLKNLARFSNNTKLMKVEENEMRTVIEKMVERYSGVLNPTIANEELKKIALSFPTDRQDFKLLEGEDVFYSLRANKPEIIKEFVQSINADTRITHKFDDDMVLTLENELIHLGLLSVTNKQSFFYDESFGWRSAPIEKEYYIIQPAIKYYHLKNALEYVEQNEHYNMLSEKGKQYVTEKLDSKIRGDMTEQIILYEMSKALPTEQYAVYKVCFSNATEPNRDRGEYDMLIYDKQSVCYWCFEIKHTNAPYSMQYKHLISQKYREAADYKYGTRKKSCVLYNGSSFKTTLNVLYLNISDFIKQITYAKDVNKVITSFETSLQVRNIEEHISEPKLSASTHRPIFPPPRTRGR